MGDLRPFDGLVKVLEENDDVTLSRPPIMTEEEIAATDASIVAIEPVIWYRLLLTHYNEISSFLEQWAEKIAIDAGRDVSKLKAPARETLMSGEIPLSTLKSKLCSLLVDKGVDADNVSRAVNPLIVHLTRFGLNERERKRILAEETEREE